MVKHSLRLNIAKGIIQELFNEQEGKCNICKFPLEEGKYHVEHKKAVSEGGSHNVKSNLQLICIECHFKKHGKIPRPNLSKNMISLSCDVCGRIIAGYNQNHAEHLLAQHKLSHGRI